jgi:hypothetical protein
MSYAFSQPNDGYTLAGVSESCVTAAVQGGWDRRMNVWDLFIVGGSPDVISVTPRSPWKDLKELFEAAKRSPGTIKACASGAGSIHHLNMLALEKGSGANLQFIPYKGSAPCQTAAVLPGALMLHGVTPGPMLSIEHPNFLLQVTAIPGLASIAMWVIGIVLARQVVKVLRFPRRSSCPSWPCCASSAPTDSASTSSTSTSCCPWGSSPTS